MSFPDASLTRLTFDDLPEMLDGWSRDGRSIFFFMNTRDIAGMNDVFRVPVGGGTPAAVITESSLEAQSRQCPRLHIRRTFSVTDWAASG